MMGSEFIFLEWFKKKFPYLMLEDWRAENKLLPKERRLKIEIWQRETIDIINPRLKPSSIISRRIHTQIFTRNDEGGRGLR